MESRIAHRLGISLHTLSLHTTHRVWHDRTEVLICRKCRGTVKQKRGKAGVYCLPSALCARETGRSSLTLLNLAIAVRGVGPVEGDLWGGHGEMVVEREEG